MNNCVVPPFCHGKLTNSANFHGSQISFSWKAVQFSHFFVENWCYPTTISAIFPWKTQIFFENLYYLVNPWNYMEISIYLENLCYSVNFPWKKVLLYNFSMDNCDISKFFRRKLWYPSTIPRKIVIFTNIFSGKFEFLLSSSMENSSFQVYFENKIFENSITKFPIFPIPNCSPSPVYPPSANFPNFFQTLSCHFYYSTLACDHQTIDS